MGLLDTENPQAAGTAELNGQVLKLVRPNSGSEGEAKAAPEAKAVPETEAPKRSRGRPAGSKNKPKDGAKPAKKAPAKKAPKKATMKAETKKDAKVAARTKELKERAKLGDEDAVKALKRIGRRYAAWNAAKAKKAETGKLCGEQLKAAEAALGNAIEAPLDATKVEAAALHGQLENVQERWQHLSETKAGNLEAKKAARDDLKAALDALNKAIEDAGEQLDLFESA